MLAIHPITGKEIRILQTDASLTKTSKTLAVWSEATSPVPKVWDCVGGPNADYRILMGDSVSVKGLREGSSCKLMFVQKGSLTIPVSEFQGLGLTNCLMLEELHLLYPQLGAEWDGTFEDAVAMVAKLLRYTKLWGLGSNSRAKLFGIVQETSAPFKLWWVTQYYIPSVAKRRREIQKALQINCSSSLLDRVVLLNEQLETLPEGCKRAEQIPIGHRLTYADVMKFAVTAPDNVVIAFANADIAIDSQSWRTLWSVDLQDKFIALLRYDVPASGFVEEAQIFGPRADSQDCWVVRAADVKKRSDKLCGPALEFRFGQMGCDNTIAIEMLRQKFCVVNPAQTLKTFHFHASDVRSYSKTDVLDRPMFQYVQPTGIHELEPKIQIPSATYTKPSALLRPLRGPAASAWCAKGGDLKMGSTNPLTPEPETVVDLTDCFMTPSGLVYDSKSMFVGPSPAGLERWSQGDAASLLPAVECSRVACVPWPSDCQSREDYVVRVLSKILRIRKTSDSEFYCPESKEILDALQVFQWTSARQPVIKHESDGQVWCRHATALLPNGNTSPLAEDIAALRKFVRGWETVATPRIVLVEEDSGPVMRSEFVSSLEAVLEDAFDIRVVYPGRTSAERMVDMLRGAWGVIVGSGDAKRCGWNWMLPTGARVFEVVGDSAHSFGLELSAASGLEHRFVHPTKESVVEEIYAEWSASKLASPSEDSELPLIWVPRRDLEGYFSHPGDSFREMVRLWAKAGKVRVQEHPTATMVWWNSVGSDGVLLYDRPNHDWRMAAPSDEKSWKFAVFGNPKVAVGKPGSSWFFWPRRPEFVESLVSEGVSKKSFADRSERMVFFGKTENAVQRKRRVGADWESCCSAFHMASPDEPHKFTQLEYLKELSKARFGLCLAGYGLKCHREVECMALGVVPVCASEVDMDNYANPPVAGVHYIRVKSPEEAKEVTESMSEADWEVMSKAAHEWWKTNCSVEGSFALTERLITENM